jgi:hypothetical protein
MKSRTKQSATTTSSVASTSTKSSSICDSQGKLYPSISAAYWLPASNPTPYLLPGNFFVNKNSLLSWQNISLVQINDLTLDDLIFAFLSLTSSSLYAFFSQFL